MWRGADATRIEVLRPVAAQHLAALDEEGAALVEECFESAEIHFGRIGFDLAEVRIDCRVERQIAGYGGLAVHAKATGVGAVERIGHDGGRASRRITRQVWQELHGAGRPHPFQTAQRTESRDVAGLAWRDHDPLQVFVLVRHPAINLKSPLLFGRWGKAQLREGDPHFRRPPSGVDHSSRRPHGIKLAFATAHVLVLGVPEVGADACGRDSKPDPRPAIALRIDRDSEPFRRSLSVASRHIADDLVRPLAQQAGAHIERLIVVHEVDDRSFSGVGAGNRALLAKVVYSDCRLPDGLVEYPIDLRRVRAANGGGDFRGRLAVDVGRVQNDDTEQQQA